MSVAVSVDVPVVLSRSCDATDDGPAAPVEVAVAAGAGATGAGETTAVGCADFFLAADFFFGWVEVSTVTCGNGVDAAGGAGVGGAGSAVCACAVAEAKMVPTAKHAATRILVRT
jgi:hypothetical protein